MTKVLGILFFILAATVLAVGIGNFSPQFAAAAAIADHQQEYGLETNTTDLRMGVGIEMIVQVFVAGALVMIALFLYNSETDQPGYSVAVGILVAVAVVIRMTPVLPWSLAKISPGTAFYGAAVKIPISDDATKWYVILPQNKDSRIAVADASAAEGKGVLLLDFAGDDTLRNHYDSAHTPATVIGSIIGTATIARGMHKSFLIPRMKVSAVTK